MATDTTAVWFITGCSTGFGHALAAYVLAQGNRVVVTARNVDSLSELVKDAGNRALVQQLDVTDAAQIKTAVSAATARFGRIDVLVNNAGYGYQSSVEEGSDDEIRAQFEANTFGLFALTRAILPGMRAQRSGHVMNITSVAGMLGNPSTGYYAASKHAVEGWSDSLETEVAPLGIRVTCIEPGPFRTDWAGRSLRVTPAKIDEYKESVGASIKSLAEKSGKQPGDPVRAAAVMYQIALMDNAPRHLPLGASAYERITRKLKTRLAQIEAWEATIRSADFPS
ncbi:oxidoreductase [Pusillimonas sp. ANT_WB101]|uniref:oxidoreductase n=1 Tax=Pusillimonas sp. ANT_WB101 TaxID=2597356 RepID=UPI0011ED6DDE|nr:oxidoreductase [Pusillimonas sp. ANT_WB101]KAA0892680.1 SDR family NAD(P)-dependent oxidoreductase [Pusillimonas sp. ANT_WB101]